MTTGLLITTAGQAAIAADLAGGADLVLSHVAFGDSNGVPYAPNEAQTVLVNEKYRSTIASVAVVAGAIVVDAVIPADAPDGSARPSHGFSIAEAGLYSAAGTLIGVARMGNGYKPPPSSGQAAVATFRFKLAVANPSAISVVIDPQAQIQLGRNVRPFWMTVDGVLNDPPGAPTSGDTYVIGLAPTGAWAGFANRLAQWVGVWALASVPEGHIVVDKSVAIDNSSRWLRRNAGGWGSAVATTTSIGPTRLASAAETTAGAGGLAVSPDNLSGILANLPIHADFRTSDGRLVLTPGAGNVVVTGASILWRGWKLFDLAALSAPNRTFATAANKTYHLRWDAPGTGLATPAANYPNGRLSLRDLADAAYNPGALGEADVTFDTSYDSLLVARVITNGANAATISALANKSFLRASVSTFFDQSSPGLFAMTVSFFFSCAHGQSWMWGRKPDIAARVGWTGIGTASGNFTLNGVSNMITEGFTNRYGGSYTVGSDWLEPAPTLGTYFSQLNSHLAA